MLAARNFFVRPNCGDVPERDASERVPAGYESNTAQPSGCARHFFAARVTTAPAAAPMARYSAALRTRDQNVPRAAFTAASR